MSRMSANLESYVVRPPRKVESAITLIQCTVPASRVFSCDGAYVQTIRIDVEKQQHERVGLHAPSACALSIDECYLYVADTYNDRVCVFDASSGVYRHSFGSRGSGDKHFRIPTDVCVSNAGWLYVCDFCNNRVQVLDSITGAHIRTIGKDARRGGAGKLNGGPCKVAVSREQVYVYEYQAGRVSVFSELDGRFLRSFAAVPSDSDFRYFRNIAVSPVSGNVLVADISANQIRVLNASGEVQQIPYKTMTHGGVIQSVKHVCVSMVGDVYVCDDGFGTGCVHVFDSTGAHVRTIRDDASQPSIQLLGPVCTTVSRDGRLFIVDHGNCVRVFN